ncbi:MAG TPA: hypothetical protein DIW47_14425 [Bacteroidetes bacterium]|nr:hypothetical protein [Bacteroidota bacterium]
MTKFLLTHYQKYIISLLILFVPGFIHGQTRFFEFSLDTIIYTDLLFSSDFYFHHNLAYTSLKNTVYFHKQEGMADSLLTFYSHNLETQQFDSLCFQSNDDLRSILRFDPQIISVNDSFLVMKYTDELLIFKRTTGNLTLVRLLHLNETVTHLKILSDSTLFLCYKTLVFSDTGSKAMGHLHIYNWNNNEYEYSLHKEDISYFLMYWQASSTITSTNTSIYYADKFQNYVCRYNFKLELLDSIPLKKPRNWRNSARSNAGKIRSLEKISDQDQFYNQASQLVEELTIMSRLSTLNDTTLIAVYYRKKDSKAFCEILRIRDGEILSLGIQEDTNLDPNRIITRTNINNIFRRRMFYAGENKLIIFESTDTINAIGMKEEDRYAAMRKYFETHPRKYGMLIFSVKIL